MFYDLYDLMNRNGGFELELRSISVVRGYVSLAVHFPRLYLEFRQGAVRAELERFSGATEIRCFDTYDYAIRPTDPNIIEGIAPSQLGVKHPVLAMLNAPWCSLRISTQEGQEAALAKSCGVWNAILQGKRAEILGEVGSSSVVFDYFTSKAFSNSKDGSLHASGPEQLMNTCATVFMELGLKAVVEVKAPHCQIIPGGDGEMYNLPRKFQLLQIDRSWVIAERFEISEVAAAWPKYS